MIGNSDDALLAWETYNEGYSDYLLSNDGSSRCVFLINGIVYKVGRNGYSGENILEYENMTSGMVLPENVYFPEVGIYDVMGDMIVAMEYIAGQPKAECSCAYFEQETHNETCLYGDDLALIRNVLDDSGGMNVIDTGDSFYIIDYAESAY